MERERERSHFQKQISPQILFLKKEQNCFLTIFPEGEIAAAGRQEMLEVEGRDGGLLPPNIFFLKSSKRNTRRNPLTVCCFGRGLPPKISPNILFPRNFSEGKTAAADCQGVLAGGWGGEGGGFPSNKNTHPHIFVP